MKVSVPHLWFFPLCLPLGLTTSFARHTMYLYQCHFFVDYLPVHFANESIYTVCTLQRFLCVLLNKPWTQQQHQATVSVKFIFTVTALYLIILIRTLILNDCLLPNEPPSKRGGVHCISFQAKSGKDLQQYLSVLSPLAPSLIFYIESDL